MAQTLSYAQRYEDLHLLRAFGAQPGGFYIDVGAGHPVYDNVSFAFYLRGWNGITVEPNPWLAQLSEVVRPRDHRVQSLVGSQPGEATYYLVEHFHGLSTTVADNAKAAQQDTGKAAKAMQVPVKTLASLCEQYAPREIDWLKIDVEGAEGEVLSGNDWKRFRPKVITLEALAPITMEPAWDGWEPILTANGYAFAFFDTLNRYYVANEHGGADGELGRRLKAAPESFAGIIKISDFKPALEDASHPDHRLALLLQGTDMVRLPLLPADAILRHLTVGLAGLDRPAAAADAALVHERLFGPGPTPAGGPQLPAGATVLDLYRHLIGTEQFKAASGRISASYAW
jgi:FkbM family methyltransferase